MTLPSLQYCRPQTLTEGLKLFKDNPGNTRPLAGGTDLLNNMKIGLNPADILVDITEIDTLTDVEGEIGQPLKAGAATTIWDFVQRPEVKENLTALYQAGCGVGAVQHQQMGTLGGNLCQDTRCWYYNQTRHWRRARPLCYKTGGNQCLVMKKSERCHAAFCSDLAPALIAYDTKIKLSSWESEREIALADFYTGEGKTPTVLKPGEIIREILIPADAWKTKSAYIKLRSRKSIDFPQAGAAFAVTEEDGKIVGSHLVLTALESGPVQVKNIAALFQGLPVIELDAERMASLAQACAAEAAKQILPVANMTWRPSYRRRMTEVLIEQLLQKVLGNL